LESCSHWLSEVEVPDALAHRVGYIGDEQVELRTRRFRGGALESLTFASISDTTGMCRSVTLIGFPTADSPLPILGVDLIAFRRHLSLVALDYAPTNFAYWNQTASPVLRHLRDWTESHLKARKRPEFTVDAFSDLAIISASPRGSEAIACEAATRLLSTYLNFARESMVWPSQPGDQTVAQWCEAERQNRKEHDALGRVFGSSFAESYLAYLFTPASPAYPSMMNHHTSDRSSHHVGH
ncbi:MAG: hypothetical protein AAFY60_15225, partial [Myxococcota bacterium]